MPAMSEAREEAWSGVEREDDSPLSGLTPRSDARQVGRAPAPEARDEAPVMDVARPELEGDVAAGEPSEAGVDEHPYVSAMGASIISLVADLGRQLDTAYELKDALEAELVMTRQELSDVSCARAELMARVTLLEGRAPTAEQLREELASLQDERNGMASVLDETRAQLEQTAKERDSLAEQMSGTEENREKLQQENAGLGEALSALEEKLAEMERLRQELEEAGGARRELESRVEDLTQRLEASSTSGHALESELATSREDAAQLREELSLADGRLDELRAQCEEQKAEARDLRAANRRFEQAFEKLTAQHKAARNGLGAAKKALCDIHAAAARIHERHHRPKEAEQA